jgi:CBS domain.
MLVCLTVQDVVTPELLTTAADATAREVLRTHEESHVGSLMLVAEGEPVGIVTESDPVRPVSEGRDLDTARVSALISEELAAVGPDELATRTAELLGGTASAGSRRRGAIVTIEPLPDDAERRVETTPPTDA